jgi:ribosomal protein S12 methylthiotransferase
MKKVCLVSLGCAKNIVDSEAILGLFRSDDFSIVTDPNESDLIIVNTCGFINSAKVEGIDTILAMAKYKKKLVVTGCLVERYYEELKKAIPEVDLWVKFEDEYTKLPSILQGLFPKEKVNDTFDFSNRVLSTGGYSAYLKISEGCDNFCSFCAIPFIRGRFVSYPEEELVKQAKDLAKSGVKELVLIGQDPTSYGKDFKDEKTNLVSILTKLAEIDGIEFIRTLYLYPEGVSDELLNLIKSNPKFVHYFDIPIQHASDRILKAMNRRDTVKLMRSLFQKIKREIPDAILRTTVIVGFPGENKEDIEDLKAFIKEIGFNHLGVFTYSKEEGTRAARMDGQITKKVKESRRDEIMELQSTISYQKNKELIGRTFKGLVIGKDNGDYLVRIDYNSPDDIDGNVIMTSELEHHNGDIVFIEITNVFVYDLFGHEISTKGL